MDGWFCEADWRLKEVLKDRFDILEARFTQSSREDLFRLL
jgi:hypothetical protein